MVQSHIQPLMRVSNERPQNLALPTLGPFVGAVADWQDSANLHG